MKLGALQEQLKKSLEEKNEKVLLDLEKSLEREWQEMQRRIEKNIQNQNQKILKEMKESLENIDWELEQCRIRQHWIWAISGLITGIILTIIIFRIMMKG